VPLPRFWTGYRRRRHTSTLQITTPYQYSRCPESEKHPALCPGYLDQARQLGASLDVTALPIPVQVSCPEFPCLLSRTFSNLSIPTFKTLDAIQKTELGSRQFYLRLLELLAASCHHIAVYLYELSESGSNRHRDEYERWRTRPANPNHIFDHYRPRIPFVYGPYTASHQYPHGLADVAAYWAESRIFGGIMVFDRGDTETEVCS
jgi:hypothetical protein